MKLILIATLTFTSLLAEVGTDSVDPDGVLRDGDGHVLEMNQADAIRSCAKHGMHLPTAREMVKLYEAAGNWIKEPSEVEEGEVAWPVYALNPDGKTDSFFFGNQLYVRPSYNLS